MDAGAYAAQICFKQITFLGFHYSQISSAPKCCHFVAVLR